MAAEIQFTSEYMIVMCLGHHIVMMVKTFLVNNDMLLCKPEDKKGQKYGRRDSTKPASTNRRILYRLLSNWESQVFFLLISKHTVSQNKENRIIAKGGKRNETRNKYSQEGSQIFPEGWHVRFMQG